MRHKDCPFATQVDKPKCRGYVHNERWGTCVASKPLDSVGPRRLVVNATTRHLLQGPHEHGRDAAELEAALGVRPAGLVFNRKRPQALNRETQQIARTPAYLAACSAAFAAPPVEFKANWTSAADAPA